MLNMKKKTAIILVLGLLLSTTTLLNFPVAKGDTLVECFDVSSDGTPVTSSVLDFGKKYKIVASEIFWYDKPNGYAADAMYYTTDTNFWQWTNVFPAPDGHSFLQINGEDIDWGPFSNGDTGHTYTLEMMGEGDSLTFQIIDWLEDPQNPSPNECHLRVCIYEVPGDYYGATPGFWKNHPDAWPEGYYPSTVLNDVFPAVSEYSLSGDTLMDALRYKGGKGELGAARILLRAAVAAVLNAEHAVINYPMTYMEIVTAVNNALLSHDRDTMIDLATDIDNNNNLGTPWD